MPPIARLRPPLRILLFSILGLACHLPAGALGQEIEEVRQLALTHSGAYDFYRHEGRPAGDSVYPYVTRMARAAGQSYLLDGTFFSSMGDPVAMLEQIRELTADDYRSQWTVDSETPLAIANVPGETFAERAYDSFMISPSNWRRYYLDEKTSRMIFSPEGHLTGLNAAAEPTAYREMVAGYVAVCNAVPARSPAMTIHFYHFLAPAYHFPEPENPAAENTIRHAHVEAYAEYALGLYEQWFDRFMEDLRTHPELRPGARLETVPVNRVVVNYLRLQPEILVGRDWFDFARDGAPHFGNIEGESDFFEALIAPVLYTRLFKQQVPESYSLRPGNIFEPYFRDYVDYVASLLLEPRD